jgi:hypothetical protein
MIKFILLVNKQGQTRVAQYHEYKEVQARAIDEVKTCGIAVHAADKLACSRTLFANASRAQKSR